MKKSKVLSFLMGGILCATMALSSAQTAYAAERTVDKVFINESSYEQTMRNTVEPYVNSAKRSGYLNVGQANFQIYYEKYKVAGSKGNIVISHGFTESLEKYHELIYYFMKEGYSVYGLEHRGHGRSGHLGKVDETQVNVNNFEDYVSDLKAFLDNVVVPETRGQKLFLFAHSMGGGIGTRFLEEHPNYFNAAILSSPMMEVNTGGIPQSIAKLIANAALPTSYADKYIANQGKYNGAYDFAGAATTSEARYAYSHNVINANREIQRGGGSYRWLQTSFSATGNMRNDAANATAPILLFQAENDSFVNPGGQNTFRDKARNCTLVRIPGAKHEIYMEKDSILKPYLDKVMDFYNQH